jgi:hypothetical protein
MTSVNCVLSGQGEKITEPRAQQSSSGPAATAPQES